VEAKDRSDISRLGQTMKGCISTVEKGSGLGSSEKIILIGFRSTHKAVEMTYQLKKSKEQRRIVGMPNLVGQRNSCQNRKIQGVVSLRRKEIQPAFFARNLLTTAVSPTFNPSQAQEIEMSGIDGWHQTNYVRLIKDMQVSLKRSTSLCPYGENLGMRTAM